MIISRCEDTMQYASLLPHKDELFTPTWQCDAGLSAIVHACNDVHMSVYEELDYSNDTGELSEEGKTGEWRRKIPGPMVLYQKMRIIIKK